MIGPCEDSSKLVVGVPRKWYVSPVRVTVDRYKLAYGWRVISHLVLYGTTEYGEEIRHETVERDDIDDIVQQIIAYEEAKQ